MRRTLAALILLGGPILLLARKRERRERVHLYYDDGSMVTLERGAGAERLLALARQAL